MSACLKDFQNQAIDKKQKWSDNISIILEQELINAGEALHDAQQSQDPRSGLIKTINHLLVTATHFEKRAICTHFESTDPRRYMTSAQARAQAALCNALTATISAGLEEPVLAMKYAEYFKVNFMLYLADIDLSGQLPKREEIGYHGLFLLSFVTRLLPIRNATEERFAERFLALCLRNDDHFHEIFHQRLSAWYPKIL